MNSSNCYRRTPELISCLIAALLVLFAFYYYGTCQDISYIKYALHPENFNDPIWFSLFYCPYSYVDRFMAFVYSTVESHMSLERFVFIVYGLILFLSLYLIAKLMQEIFKNRIVGILSVFAFALNIRIISLGAPHLIRYYFSPFSFALPLLVLSLIYFYRQRYVTAFSLAALSLNLHITTSLYLLLIYSLMVLFRAKRISFKEILSSLGMCILFGAPTLIPVILSLKNQVIVEPWVVEFYRYITCGHISLYYIFKFYPSSVITSLAVLGALVICNNRHSEDKESRAFINNFFLASAIIYIAQIIGADVLHSFFFVKLQLLSSTWFVMLLGLGVFINFIISQLNSQGRDYIYIIAILGSGFSILLFAFWGACGYIGKAVLGRTVRVYKLLKKLLEKYDFIYIALLPVLVIFWLFLKKDNILQYSLFTLSLMLIFYLETRNSRFTYIGITFFILCLTLNAYLFNQPKHRDLLFYDICKVTSRLDSDAKVISPITKFDYYSYGERADFFSRTHFAQTKFNAESFADEYQISQELGVDFKDNIGVDPVKYAEVWRLAWVSLDEKQFLRLKNKYKVTHIIRENEHPLDFSVIARNKKYTLYSIE